VKLWSGNSGAQKKRLAGKITKDVMDAFDYGEESLSVAFEEVPSQAWKQKVYKPDIQDKWDKVYERPGYEM
jgi:4-oxalocrotonate tautomerase